MKVSTYEKLHNLDESMHLHVGYDEHGFDCEGVFFKSLDRKCTKGLFDQVPNEERGIFKQLTDHYPELKIKVTSERDPSVPYPRDTLSFDVKNGVTENVVKIKK
ncbi:DUF3986 family protein [Bacillus altitudinis]|uniref:DUF3986 family protein n=1 Tax=Bacillus altitudinis TaxID=293387 RepID=UPI001F23AAE6|nr:DUF3986 family protein [Bacillus altitudinis]